MKQTILEKQHSGNKFWCCRPVIASGISTRLCQSLLLFYKQRQDNFKQLADTVI
jgi:hypothetical protein